MKELDKNDRISEKQGIEAVIKKQHELKLEGELKPIKGHTLFEINTVTLEVQKAKFVDKKTISYKEALKIASGTFINDVIFNKDCKYISALNAENALDRHKKGKGSAKMSEGMGFDL